MIRSTFAIFHLLLGGYFLHAAAAPFLAGARSFDAGAVPLFVAAWFLTAAVGFLVRNVWLVTMAHLALASVAGLYLFIAAAGQYSRGAGPDPWSWSSPGTAAGLLLFLVAGQIAAMVQNRRAAGKKAHAPEGRAQR